MNRTLKLLACLGLVLASLVVDAAPAVSRPNIVLIVADDLGYGDLGCYGATKLKTPNLDRLARHGLRFTQAYAPSSTCTPSRYALMTGEYGWRQTAKKTSILNGDAPLCIEPGRLTLPAMLKQAGYTTALIGKWHLGLGDGVTPVDFNTAIKPGPLEVGFDLAFFMPATLDRVPTVFIDNQRVVRLESADPIGVSYQHRIGTDPIGSEHPELLKQRADPQHSGTIINGISRIGYMQGGKAARWVDENIAAILARHAVAFIDQNRQQPFFLYFALHEPHVPRAPGTRFRGASQCGIRGDAIVECDWMVGEVLAELDRCKLADHTLVMATSDNGPILFDGYYDDADQDCDGHQPAGPLRGWKYLVFEGGTRVPFIATWPGHIRSGVTDQMLGLNDLLATCAALTGQALPPEAGPDSLNLLPALLGKAKEPLRTEIVEHGISGTLALRQGDWKFIPATPGTEASGMGSGADPKDKRFVESRIPEPLLFNLKTDPGETRNLAKEMPERAAAMNDRLGTIQHKRPSAQP
jgi:arylsulfatase A-like enzyme